MIITETPRLLLRLFDTQDANAMRRVLCDPEVMFFSMGVMNPTDVDDWIDDCIKRYSQFGFGVWGVVLKDTNALIGYCGLRQNPDVDGRSETAIGFRFAREFWSFGYATESAAAVRDYAFGTLALPRLIAVVDPGNTASTRVVEKIGMSYEKDVMLPGYDHPDRLYSTHRTNGDVTPKPAAREPFPGASGHNP